MRPLRCPQALKANNKPYPDHGIEVRAPHKIPSTAVGSDGLAGQRPWLASSPYPRPYHGNLISHAPLTRSGAGACLAPCHPPPQVMCRFAAVDPVERSKYFGRSFDLGQFERFRRVFHTPAYRALLNHDRCAGGMTRRLGQGLGAGGHASPARFMSALCMRVCARVCDGVWARVCVCVSCM